MLKLSDSLIMTDGQVQVSINFLRLLRLLIGGLLELAPRGKFRNGSQKQTEPVDVQNQQDAQQDTHESKSEEAFPVENVWSRIAAYIDEIREHDYSCVEPCDCHAEGVKKS